MGLVKKCMWKVVAENDDKKRESGEGCVTLSKDKPCYSCDGLNDGCDAYHAYEEEDIVEGV